MTDGVSIVIPTINRSTFLINTINSILSLSFQKSYEIIIVDQSSTIDKSILSIFKDNKVIRYFHVTTFRGLPEARNFGWQHALYDYILYLDDDIEIDSNLLEEHYKYIVNPEIGIVAGGITEKYKKNPQIVEIGKYNFYTATPIRGFNMNKKCYVDHAPGGNFSIKKELIQKCGGSDEYLNVGAALYEESDLCLRVKKNGFKIFFNYDAHIFHLAANSGGCRVTNIERYVSSLVHNRAILIARHLNPLQRLTATISLLKLVASYSISYRHNLFGLFSKPFKKGWADGLKKPKCGNYK